LIITKETTNRQIPLFIQNAYTRNYSLQKESRAGSPGQRLFHLERAWSACEPLRL